MLFMTNIKYLWLCFFLTTIFLYPLSVFADAIIVPNFHYLNQHPEIWENNTEIRDVINQCVQVEIVKPAVTENCGLTPVNIKSYFQGPTRLSASGLKVNIVTANRSVITHITARDGKISQGLPPSAFPLQINIPILSLNKIIDNPVNQLRLDRLSNLLKECRCEGVLYPYLVKRYIKLVGNPINNARIVKPSLNSECSLTSFVVDIPDIRCFEINIKTQSGSFINLDTHNGHKEYEFQFSDFPLQVSIPLFEYNITLEKPSDTISNSNDIKKMLICAENDIFKYRALFLRLLDLTENLDPRDKANIVASYYQNNIYNESCCNRIQSYVDGASLKDYNDLIDIQPGLQNCLQN